MRDKAKGENTYQMNLIGVNFKRNISLSARYAEYLSSSPLTCPKTLASISPSSVMMATSDKGTMDPLTGLTRLSARRGFTRCAGRLFAMRNVSDSVEAFYSKLRGVLPGGIIIRIHAHPFSFSGEILDFIDEQEVFKLKKIICSPTEFSHLLVAVRLDEARVGWGLFTKNEYKNVISRPGDGDPSPTFDLNFNRAELKIAEALQLLSIEESKFLFTNELLAVDVGAAPGGWTRYLATHRQEDVKVIAIDPAELDKEVEDLNNVAHLRLKAQMVEETGMLKQEGARLLGDAWRDKFRLLVCDANMDIRDTLRELVMPLSKNLVSGGVLIVTIKLGRRVGKEGIAVKEESAKNILIEGGMQQDSIRIHWLFGNSNNERTIVAVKS